MHSPDVANNGADARCVANKSILRFVYRAVLMVLWALIMPALYFLGKWLRFPNYMQIVHHFHAGCRRILGLQVEYQGELHSNPPTLYVANHVSYLDIFVLGNIPGYFIAKSEVANWPVLGTYARFQNTLFFERRSTKAKQQIQVMHDHLQSSKSLILFPEGTSTDGIHVEPFKSSLFAVASQAEETEKRVAIQPVTLSYTHHNGKKMPQEVRDYYAWYADMTFGGHFFEMMKMKNIGIKVTFHPVCYIDEFETRKHCADYCQQIVADQLSADLQLP